MSDSGSASGSSSKTGSASPAPSPLTSPALSANSSLVEACDPSLPTATAADGAPPGPSAEEVSNIPDAERKARALKLKDEGNAKFLKGLFDEAKDLYAQAILLDDSVPHFWSNRAACELKLEQHGLAIEDATKAIQLDPKFSKAYFRRASGYLAILKPKNALPDLRKVVQLEPKNATVRAQLDSTVKLIRRLDFEQAIKVEAGPKKWEEALELVRDEAGAAAQPPASYDGPKVLDLSPNEVEELKSDRYGADVLGKIDGVFVEKLVEFYKEGGKLPTRYAWQIMLGAFRLFTQEPTMVEYTVPEGTTIDVIGDTHGQLYEFAHMLTLTGPPSETHALLFNGDFVDRGSWSVEIALIIMAYKCAFPKTTLVNRGNHEAEQMNKVYGFEGEVKAKFGGDFTFKLFTELFNALPLATLITATKEPLQGADLPASAPLAQKSPILSAPSVAEGGRKRYFVVHGGLFSKDGVTLDDVRKIDRYQQPGQEGLMSEALWADPQVANGRGPSKRGVGLGFGPDITRKWCELNGVTAVIRSHEVRQGGYAEEHDGRCNTVFSAANYCDSTGNKGAFGRIDAAGTIQWITFDAQDHPMKKTRPPMYYANSGFSGMM
ncbi:Palmitoyl-protein thioesterase 1 [Tilletia horrida]|uniref:Serine/threonine-protein phosphatase n=1 Tax=Tilletia horrida TaxID=155126 RepID=A0AAN6JQN9_9BASI|nr:Palmitoyl-protein thioesterase 1 [Tilletia horrida]KAK0568960.1 Palmitoyl-protein thioesterase 1 [Tilletia horrida]